MSDKGEKMCPLCTEEMDLTDKQLKPCSCGYEICVWCWHHIMDMAEKDNTEGRCPACRTPYDKEKIVERTEKCGRLVAEINSVRKMKSQKAKPKSSEAKKHLSSVRVIRRNLVYIIGLPLSLADEDLLQRTEYFGQYGKVLKASISRTASGAIQHASNNSCSVFTSFFDLLVLNLMRWVPIANFGHLYFCINFGILYYWVRYITYSKEEEAVRCIQSVHDFVLEGRPLRACFGTTKYCHSWLRNLPCNIPDCLYLHEFGSQEDSFSKDEVVSAFTRNRVQQIVGVTNNLQQRSGDVLPSPMDAYNNISSSEKPAAKSPTQNTGSQVRGSFPDDSSGRSSSLPASASWVSRVSSSRPSAASLSSTSKSVKQNFDTFDGPSLSEAVSTKRSNHDVGNRSTHPEENYEVHPNGKLDPLESTKHYNDTCSWRDVLNSNEGATPDSTPAVTVSGNCSPLSACGDTGRDIAAPSITSSIDLTKQSYSSGQDTDGNFDLDKKFPSLCSGLSSINIHDCLEDGRSTYPVQESSVSSRLLTTLPKNQEDAKQFREATSSLTLGGAAIEDDQRLKSSEDIFHPPCLSCSPNLQTSDQSRPYSLQQGEVYSRSNISAEPRTIQMKHDKAAFSHAPAKSVFSNGFYNNQISSSAELDETVEYSDLVSEKRKGEVYSRSNVSTEPRMAHMRHDEAAFQSAPAKSIFSNGFYSNQIRSAELDEMAGYSNLVSDMEKKKGEIYTLGNVNTEPRVVQMRHNEASFQSAPAKPVQSNGFYDKTRSFPEMGGLHEYPVQMRHNEAAFQNASANSVQSNGFYDKTRSFPEMGGLHEYPNMVSDMEKGKYMGRFDNNVVRAENNGFYDKTRSFSEMGGLHEYPRMVSDMEKGKYMGRLDNNVLHAENGGVSDMGENNIISNILSMDLDPWDDHNFVKLLSETDRQQGALKIPSARKAQSSNQSRFSFARQDDLPNLHVSNTYSAPMEKKNPYMDEYQNIFSPNGFPATDHFSNSRSFTSSNKLPVQKARVSAPPGFSVPTKAPPPGFSFQDGVYQAISRDLLQTSSYLGGGQFQTSSTTNVGSPRDIEFMDPAILEVRRTLSPPQLSPFEQEARIQLLMQQHHQNLNFSDQLRKRFSPTNDGYGMPQQMHGNQSQVTSQFPYGQLSAQQFRNGGSHVSNGHWSGRNEMNRSSEHLANERMGFNNFMSSYDDLKLRGMPGSGNVYNQGYGM